MNSVFDALARHARTRPDALAFRDDNGAVSWQQLTARVADLAHRLADAPQTVGIGLAGGIDYVVADLAITLTGRRQVPLPFFFSTAQNAHILMDAGIGAVVARDPALFAPLPQIEVIDPAFSGETRALPTYQGNAERVIYTSGSSGHPKGVIIGDAQSGASLRALSDVVGASSTDRHLSILPLAQLLEQICGIFLPILAGAETVFRFEATKALFGAPIAPLSAAFEDIQPTTSLLAPAILGRWVADLTAKGKKAPQGLRFVAVGGASTAPTLIKSALSVGIPVCEGYGLSECCAVVAMNRPGDSVAGTVGQILDGLDVQLVDGEITVAGPTVMVGYLNGDPAPTRWHTGDLGHFNGDRLVIDGRKDALLVTGAGRNISPEWVEQRVNADPRIVSSALGLRASDDALVLIVVAAAPVTVKDLAQTLGDLPPYARPCEVILTDPSEPNLLFPVGTPNRAVAKTLIDTRPSVPLGAPEPLESIAS
jgi:long-subunit acyl-CoA synthetase (AMP-forming)